MQLDLLSRAPVTEVEATANAAREQMIGIAGLALSLSTVVVFSFWIVRANKNVGALGAVGLPIGPGWALGYFFIPILNLWKPYQAMRDLWQASHSPTEYVDHRSPILPTWWGLWLLNGLIAQISIRLMLRAETIDEIQSATYVTLASVAVNIPLCLVAIMLVSGITRAQNGHAAEIAASRPDDLLIDSR